MQWWILCYRWLKSVHAQCMERASSIVLPGPPFHFHISRESLPPCLQSSLTMLRTLDFVSVPCFCLVVQITWAAGAVHAIRCRWSLLMWIKGLRTRYDQLVEKQRVAGCFCKSTSPINHYFHCSRIIFSNYDSAESPKQ